MFEGEIQTILLAVVSAVVIAFVKISVAISVAEQWRAWVFVLLNILLASILFTSTKSASSTTCKEDTDSGSHLKASVEIESEKRKCKRRTESVEDHCESGKKIERRAEEHREGAVVEESGVEEEREIQISEEDLNARVEAFIAMFRQHLASDAIGRSQILLKKSA